MKNPSLDVFGRQAKAQGQEEGRNQREGETRGEIARERGSDGGKKRREKIERIGR